MRTRLVLAAAPVAALALAVAPALAAPKPKPKPITKTWTATAVTPDPSHTGVTSGICNTTLPTAQHNEPFAVPYAGVLKVDMTGFVGDWDLAVYQGDKLLAESAQAIGDAPDTPEKITMKFKRGGAKLSIRSCNFSGGPTADMALVFTAS